MMNAVKSVLDRCWGGGYKLILSPQSGTLYAGSSAYDNAAAANPLGGDQAPGSR